MTPRSFIRIALAAFLFLALSNHEAYAQDVYNFYFQKAAGPQTVIQGGGPQQQPASNVTIAPDGGVTTSPVVANAPATSVSAVAASQPDAKRDSELKRWQVNLSYASMADRVGRYTGYAVGGEYNFNKYVAAQGQLLITKPRHDYDNGASDLQKADVAVGAVVTPIHTNIFGYNFLDFSVLGGVMTTRSSSFDNFDRSHDRKLAPYLGMGLAVHFGQNISTIMQIKVQDERRYGQLIAGLAVRF